MEPRNILQMEEEIKKEIRETVIIEIDWDNQEDLIELSTNLKFREFILNESYKSIMYALENNLKKAELFNIFNVSVIIEIKKSQFKSVLSRVAKLFLEKEEYEKCSIIKKTITKYEI